MSKEAFDYCRPIKPTKREIFYALTGEETNPDWDLEILEKADPEDIEIVNKFRAKFQLYKEAEIELGSLEK